MKVTREDLRDAIIAKGYDPNHFDIDLDGFRHYGAPEADASAKEKKEGNDAAREVLLWLWDQGYLFRTESPYMFYGREVYEIDNDE